MLDNFKKTATDTYRARMADTSPSLTTTEITGILAGRIAAKISLAIVPTCMRKKIAEWINRSIDNRWNGQP